MRKTYGNTWWGKQWLNALTDIDYSNRLPRGRTYANKGLVHDILIQGNQITAKVQGSRPKPYNVEFTIPKFTTNEHAALLEIVTANPLYLSKLLNRQLPVELNEICTRIGLDIFPNAWDDLEGRCSCPDWAVPCKHLAAVLYLIANEIDQNPFLVFQLHDFDLFEGLEAIGYATAKQKEIPVLALEDLQQDFSLEKASHSWDEEVYQQLDFSRIPNCAENLLTILSEKPVFYPNGDFKSILAKAYTSISKLRNTKSLKKLDDPIANTKLQQVEEVEILLDEGLDFLTTHLKNRQGQSIFIFDHFSELILCLEKIPLSALDQLSIPLKALHLVYRFAYQLIAQAACIPQLLRIDARQYKVRWLAANLNSNVRSIHDGVKSIVPSDLIFYTRGKKILEPIDQDKFTTLLALFLNHFVKENHRMDARFRENKIGHLFFNTAIVQFLEPEEKEYPAAIQLWLHNFFIAKKQFVPVLQVDEGPQGFEVNLAVQDRSKPLEPLFTLSDLLLKKNFQSIRLDVLRDLARLSEYFPQINQLVNSKGAEALFFDSDTFVQVLFKILPTIRLFGIKVLLPKSLQKLMRPQLSMSLATGEEKGIIQKKSTLQLGEIINFQWQIAIGDQQFNQEEFSKLIDQFSGIVKINDQYVFFDEKEIKNLIKKLKDPPPMPSNQLLQLALTEDYQGAKVLLEDRLKQLINGLLKPEKVALPKSLRATLRPYQLSGYEWLYKNARIGFGSLIADDMGLGKTLQVITTLLKLKEDGALENRKALIIVPTTLLGNWEKEIKKFAPFLIPHIYHGTKRQLKPTQAADVLITTYGVVRTDLALLQKEDWLIVVIDEAQNIKNPTTTQSKAVKKINAPIKIAMSGTPVENRLSEYWSIFDFANKAYLSTLSKFKEEFAKPIELHRDQLQLERFKKITQPFILRRLKSDKSIIKDLPDKIEKDQFCQLSPEQSAIYQSVVNATLTAIEQAEGIARKGLVLKLLTSLKQICNHPKQFLKKGDADPALSGKAMRLLHLMQQILDHGEKTLLFTQYQGMGKLLVEILANAFQLEVPFLHGGLNRKQRDAMVEDFQNNRATKIMILSLKAGGTGLNLTAANNVIHYDLWWNPAVEAQATDRAYRIGQQKNVMVHRFITKSTFEEKINEMLQEKKELANLTVSTGEKWIGDLNNTELKKLVSLD